MNRTFCIVAVLLVLGGAGLIRIPSATAHAVPMHVTANPDSSGLAVGNQECETGCDLDSSGGVGPPATIDIDEVVIVMDGACLEPVDPPPPCEIFADCSVEGEYTVTNHYGSTVYLRLPPARLAIPNGQMGTLEIDLDLECGDSYTVSVETGSGQVLYSKPFTCSTCPNS